MSSDVSLQEIADYDRDPNREIQRINALRYVAEANSWRSSVDSRRDFCSLTAPEQDERLFSFAKKICKRKQFVFYRFQQLSVFNVLKAQHALVLLEKKLQCDYKDNKSNDDQAGSCSGKLGPASNAYGKLRHCR